MTGNFTSACLRLVLVWLVLLCSLPALAQVPPGNALAFDGTDDYVALPNATPVPTGNGTYTLEAWIKPTAMGVYGIIGWGNYGTTNQTNALRLTPTGIVNYWFANDLAVTTPSLAGSWHYVVATFDGTVRTIYLDGGAVGSDRPSGHAVPNAANLRIGSTYNGEYFSGGIDEVRVWNVARTACGTGGLHQLAGCAAGRAGGGLQLQPGHGRRR